MNIRNCKMKKHTNYIMLWKFYWQSEFCFVLNSPNGSDLCSYSFCVPPQLSIGTKLYFPVSINTHFIYIIFPAMNKNSTARSGCSRPPPARLQMSPGSGHLPHLRAAIPVSHHPHCKNLLLIANLNPPSFSLKPFHLLLSQ